MILPNSDGYSFDSDSGDEHKEQPRKGGVRVTVKQEAVAALGWDTVKEQVLDHVISQIDNDRAERNVEQN